METEKINDHLLNFQECEDGERIFYLVLLINCDCDNYINLPILELSELCAMHPNRIFRARTRLIKKNLIKMHRTYSRETGKIETTVYEIIG
jgi:hypothetical protein